MITYQIDSHGKIIRQVRVMQIVGATALVVALNGPLKGTEYEISLDKLAEEHARLLETRARTREA